MKRRDFLGAGALAALTAAATPLLACEISTPVPACSPSLFAPNTGTPIAFFVPYTGTPIAFMATREEGEIFWFYQAHSWPDLVEQLLDPTRWVGDKVRIHGTLERSGRGSLLHAVMLHYDVTTADLLGQSREVPEIPLLQGIGNDPCVPARGWPLWDSSHRAIWHDYRREGRAMYVADREQFLKCCREDQHPDHQQFQKHEQYPIRMNYV